MGIGQSFFKNLLLKYFVISPIKDGIWYYKPYDLIRF
jgi:hypothetical protein